MREDSWKGGAAREIFSFLAGMGEKVTFEEGEGVPWGRGRVGEAEGVG